MFRVIISLPLKYLWVSVSIPPNENHRFNRPTKNRETSVPPAVSCVRGNFLSVPRHWVDPIKMGTRVKSASAFCLVCESLSLSRAHFDRDKPDDKTASGT